MRNQPAVPTPSTAQTSWDWLRLGRTAGQRAAEIVAGLRAVTFPSPEAKALSTAMGRWFARFLANLTGDEAVINATGGRHICLTRLAQEWLAEERRPKVIVELAAGFSTRGLLLAQTFPETQVIEVDLPGVIQAKQERIRRFVGLPLPPNLRWLSADLAKVPLPQLLGGQTVDMVIVEGLLPYFPPEWITQFAATVYASLGEKGIMLTDLVASRGWRRIQKQSGLATWLLKRQAGQFKGGVEDGATARQLFERAGYGQIKVSSLQELASIYLPGLAVADVSFLVAAHKDGQEE